MILRIVTDLEKGNGLNFKELDRYRGCLVYIFRAYQSMVSYLKVIHQTFDSWESGINEVGWKLSPEELKELNITVYYDINNDIEALLKLKMHLG